MKSSRLVLCLLIFIIVLTTLPCLPVEARSLNVNSLDYDMTILADGSLAITETLDITFRG